MTVLRIVPNLYSETPEQISEFYETLFGLEQVMNQGWIVTLASKAPANPQLSIASQGGSDTPLPDLSIEVEKVDEVYAKARTSGYEITYPMTIEPWGVRRFYVKDPAGRILNVLSHA